MNNAPNFGAWKNGKAEEIENMLGMISFSIAKIFHDYEAEGFDQGLVILALGDSSTANIATAIAHKIDLNTWRNIEPEIRQHIANPKTSGFMQMNMETGEWDRD